MLSDATYIAMFMCYLYVIYISCNLSSLNQKIMAICCQNFLGGNNISPLERGCRDISSLKYRGEQTEENDGFDPS